MKDSMDTYYWYLVYSLPLSMPQKSIYLLNANAMLQNLVFSFRLFNTQIYYEERHYSREKKRALTCKDFDKLPFMWAIHVIYKELEIIS